MNNNSIYINILEQDDYGVSFRHFIDDEYNIEKEFKEEINWSHENELYTFHFQNKIFKNKKVEFKDKLGNSIDGRNYNNKETINLIMLFNIAMDNDGNYQSWGYSGEFKKIIQENKYKTIKLFIIIIRCETMFNNGYYKDDYYKETYNKIIEFKEEMLKNSNLQKELTVDYIQVTPYSINKKYQNDFIINMVTNYFSNNTDNGAITEIKNNYSNYKETIEKSIIDKSIIQIFKSKGVLFNKLDLYKEISKIDITNLKEIILQEIESNEELLLKNHYDNLLLLYTISKIEYNFTFNNWLGMLLFKELKTLDNISILLLGRITQSEDVSIFKYQFELYENQQTSNKLFEVDLSSSFSYILKTPIYYLVENKNFEIISWLMEFKNSTFEKQFQIEWQTHALLSSSECGDIELFKYILNHANSVVKVSSSVIGFILIHYASRNGNLNILKYIFEELGYNESISKITTLNNNEEISNQTPIHFAATTLQKDTIDYLFKVDKNNDFNINSVDLVSGATPLFNATIGWYSSNTIEKKKRVL